ncbi:acyl-CoA/sterol acyltransferase [Aureobasidium pullulans]|uniref:Acyl-CoA/sterol acyltransferase n=3 Tax=Aureobasidium pullulans TaxID=5580 RepID=A0A4V4JZA6_AURPU|nr:acyl-CoA/sterol acyltransferase [Aureobasidium pullulans]THX26700.1 acyl-CoA/sterol acyltransferase [Aureobasidium pullulans]THX95327.1 acyl-CoA/sterol acyltransferase [Aureobasidium pullulans]THY40083.1 acyl-CoA/sterol acyltransferase [Aureobasidium pullulans]THZ59541.1 acyl-CoA/sterol acyltransferase [Aureobasidium pullulans]
MDGLARESRRPGLKTSDTLDAQELVGSIAKDGTASLEPRHRQTTYIQNADFSNSSSSTSLTSDEDIEDYDKIKLDPDTIVDGSSGGPLGNPQPVADPDADQDLSLKPSSSGVGHIRRNPDSHDRQLSPDSRRKSIQIRLEKTDRKGHYILTADDPDIRDILRKGMEREEASQDPSKRARSLRDLVFTRQFTTFDRQNPLSAESPFHGFFTLFWLAMVLMFLKVSAYNWKEHGSIFGGNEVFKIMFGHDVLVLGFTDAAMVFSSALGFLLQKAIVNNYISWNRSGWIIQNIWQTFFLGSVVWWMFYREWPWSHTIFMVLHTMVFLMKQHSYCFYNGHLSVVYRRRNMLREKLRDLRETKPVGSAPTSPQTISPAVTSALEHVDSGDKKRRPGALRTATNLENETSDVASVATAMQSGQPLTSQQMQAFQRIIEEEIATLDRELKGKAQSDEKAYPNNLTFANFADWTILPTLVYELEYPRQERINWWYVLEKSMATFGTMCVMQVISQAYIYPPVAETVRMKEAGMSLEERAKQMPWIVSDMLFPLLLEQLLSWYVIWECVLNVLAELTCFADRGFYGDWWNSVSWDQYARDWNRPVHNFLLRHVYHSSISAFHLSKGTATFVTFLLSALVHELVMACLFKKVRGYLFTMQLLQMPLVMLSRTKLLKGRDLLGNVVFWIGLFVGPSVLTSFYLLI